MNHLPRPGRLCTVFIFILLATSLLQAQAPQLISAALREKIDAITKQALTNTGVPSASVAIVQGGAITYLQAYGDGRIEPHTPALPSMRYSIGFHQQAVHGDRGVATRGTRQAFARPSRVAIRA